MDKRVLSNFLGAIWASHSTISAGKWLRKGLDRAQFVFVDDCIEPKPAEPVSDPLILRHKIAFNI